MGISRFVQGADHRQQTLLPECLDDYVAEDNLAYNMNRVMPVLGTKPLMEAIRA